MSVRSRWKATLAAALKARAEASAARKRAQGDVEYARRVLKRHPAKKPLRARALAEALQLCGTLEQGGNNTGPMVSKIIHANDGDIGEPWCGDFVAFCYRLAGSTSVQRFWASVAMLGNLTRVRSPKTGHIVRFTFSHTGLFGHFCDSNGREVSRQVATHIRTREGNTGASGAVSDSSTGGDGVYEKIRPIGLVLDYRRVLR